MKIKKLLLGLAAIGGVYYVFFRNKKASGDVIIPPSDTFRIQYQIEGNEWKEVGTWKVYDVGSPVVSIVGIRITSPTIISWSTVTESGEGVGYDFSCNIPTGVNMSIRISLGSVVGQSDNLII